jgi:hypothetical protein
MPDTKKQRIASIKMHGSGSSMHDSSNPLASAALLGATTFSPGTCANHASRLWLCCAPKLPTLLAVSMRSVIGTLVRPPDM